MNNSMISSGSQSNLSEASLDWEKAACGFASPATCLLVQSTEWVDPSKYLESGRYRPASETPSRWRFAGGPIVARDGMLAVQKHPLPWYIYTSVNYYQSLFLKDPFSILLRGCNSCRRAALS